MHTTVKRLIICLLAAVILCGSLPVLPDAQTDISKMDAAYNITQNITQEKKVGVSPQNTSERFSEQIVRKSGAESAEENTEPEVWQEQTKENPNANMRDEDKGGTGNAKEEESGDDNRNNEESKEDNKKDKEEGIGNNGVEEGSGNDREEGSIGNNKEENGSGDDGEENRSGNDREEGDNENNKEESGSGNGGEEDNSENSEEEEFAGEEASETEEMTEESEMISLFASSTNHTLTMPNRTSQYFMVQKNGRDLSNISEEGIIILKNEKQASQYMQTEYENGTEYNFVPRITKDTVITVGGGKGGEVSLETVKNGDIRQFGELYVLAGRLKSKAFDLEQCTTNPYAIYSNVGTWYDQQKNKIYEIDLKLTVTDYEYPNPEIQSQFTNPYTAPYVAFATGPIGVVAMGTDYVETRMEFYYHDTDKPVQNIRGMIQFIDIDAQQGVDLGEGFEDVILFDTEQTKLLYSSEGCIANSIGYICSGTSQAFNYRDINTTAVGIFSGPRVDCGWTIARCDRQDTGGEAKYAQSDGYGIPLYSTFEEAVCYAAQRSSGFLGMDTDVAIITLPSGIRKNVYRGKINPSLPVSGERAVNLAKRQEEYTYVLSTASSLPSDMEKAYYTAFHMEDQISPLLQVEEIKIFSGVDEIENGNQKSYKEVSDYFSVSTSTGEDGSTLVTAYAGKDMLHTENFYGQEYYLNIQVRVRTDEELKPWNLSLSQCYQMTSDLETLVPDTGEYLGHYAVDNQGSLFVSSSMDTETSLESNEVATRIPMEIAVKKTDQESKSPVKDVTFGLFGGDPDQYNDEKEPLYTAKTDKNGIAVFEELSFYTDQYKDGPYYIKEISVLDKYESVWKKEPAQEWTYVIDSLGEDSVVQEDYVFTRENTLENQNVVVKKHAIKVKKKNEETGKELSGAVFTLMQWSVKNGQYEALMDLKERKTDGEVYYYNEEDFTNTMDNLGNYKIMESKAPEGCVLTGETWIFHIDDNSDEDGTNIIYENTESKKHQTGILIYRNPLQRGILEIKKQNEQGNPLKDVKFQIEAAEDIYAPWDLDDQKKPLTGAKPLIKKGTVAETIRTNEQGIAKLSKEESLYIGSYIVEEVSGASGHIKGEERYQADFHYGKDQKIEFITVHLNASNLLMRPAFSVAKIADRTVDDTGNTPSLDKVSGRYLEKRIAGTYAGEEWIDYTITITNTGNVTLHQIILTDSMSKENSAGEILSKYLDMSETGFILPGNGIFLSSQGEKIRGTYLDENKLQLTLDHLNPGDCVSVHLKTKIIKNAANAFLLENEVYGQAYYYMEEKEGGKDSLTKVDTGDLLDEKGQPLTEDSDYINIPGKPSVDNVKVADKTTGVSVQQGSSDGGIKVPGIYQAGETVDFTIYIKNTGTSRLKSITVTDQMDEKLRKVTDEKTASFVLNEKKDSSCTLKTKKGKEISARIVQADTVILGENGDVLTGENCLEPEDYVELHYKLTIKDNMSGLYDLGNEVMTNAVYYDGTDDQEVQTEKDRDEIEIPGIPEARIAKLADKTTGVELKNGRYDQDAKVTGIYKQGSRVKYKITITNRKMVPLYHLKVEDILSEELQNVFIKDSIHFLDGEYKTEDGRKIRTKEQKDGSLLMDFLAGDDSVEINLIAQIKEKAGNLYQLKNIVKLTANYRSGNESQKEKWTTEQKEKLKQYTLTYENNLSSKDRMQDGQTPCVKGTKLLVAGNAFENAGYEFLSWNTKPDGSGTAYNPDEKMEMPAKDVTLYAQWERVSSEKGNKIRYHVIYDANNYTGQTEADEETPVICGSIITINENLFSHPGYEFDSWNTMPDGSGNSYKMGDKLMLGKRDVRLYAQWKKITEYQLIYDANDGSERSFTDVQTPCVYGTEVIIEGCPYTVKKEGKVWHFTAWNSRPDGTGEDILPGRKKKIYENMTLYAKWQEEDTEEAEKYMLFYRSNDKRAKWSLDEETPADKNKKITLNEPVFGRSGYHFTGWNTQADGTGQQYDSGEMFEMPDHQCSLYAQWKENETVTLTYHSNISQDLEEEQVIDAQTPTGKNQKITIDGICFDHSGHVFLNWNTKRDGSGTAYSPGAGITLEKNQDLYAIWGTDNIKEITFSLIYYSNLPGEKEIRSYVDGETVCHQDNVVNINHNMFSIKGYELKEWNTQKDGKGISYQPGDNIKMPGQNLSLYGIWTKVQNDAASDSESDSNENSHSSQDQNQQDSDFAKEQDTGEEIPEVVRESMEEEYEKIRSKSFDECIKENVAGQSLTPTEYMTDYDNISIPGEPGLKVAKAANKTKGITLVDGRYQGNRKQGTYQEQETVDYSITVTNTGTADLYHVVVKDIPSEELLNVLDHESVDYKGDVYLSDNGKTINGIKEKEDGIYTMTLDKLEAGDSVELHLTAKLKKDIGEKELKSLKNVVEVNGEYQEQENERLEVPRTEEMQDLDFIHAISNQTEEITKTTKEEKKTQTTRNAKGDTGGQKQNATSPKTGDDAPLFLYMGVFLGAAAGLLAVRIYRKYKKKE